MSVSIAARDLSKSYYNGSVFSRVFGRGVTAPKVVLDGLNFEISQGERVGIVGENGAGKSTLLRLIAGLTRQTSGEIDVRGRVHAALTLGVGLREELTGRQNLEIDGELQGLDRLQISERADAMIAFSELGDFIDRPVKTYSSGMKARLAFTGLVFIEPEILLIDEALSAGDQWFQKKAASAVRDLCTRGKIVIMVSHSRSTIVDMCSRCFWLRSGQMVADGDPRDVVAAYSAYQRSRNEEELGRQRSETDSGQTKPDSKIIGPIEVTKICDPRANASFQPTDDVTISFDVRDIHDVLSPQIILRIERVDGLIVTENGPAFEFSTFSKRGTIIKTRLSPLRLGPSTYILTVELFDGASCVDRSSTRFKVDTDKPMLGGVPSLYVPITVSAE